MLNIFWKSLVISPAILGAALAVAASAGAVESPAQKGTIPTDSVNFEIAQVQSEQGKTQVLDQVETYSNEGGITSNDQITSVNELRDVSPTDWAYEALRSLVERYGCIVGYPDRTYRGDRALTRWEFAAGLNACMNSMERLIQENVAVLKEDIEKLKRLMNEFQAELAALGARVDNLQARVSFLEDHQFSTTTKLSGEVIFAISQNWGGNYGYKNQAVFQDRVRLNFNTSFTGEDRLVTRLSAGNGVLFQNDYRTIARDQGDNAKTLQFGTLSSPTSVQTWQLSPSTNNSVAVDWLAYYTPIELGKDFKLATYIAAWGGIWSDFVPTLNPYFQDYDGGNGALSAFASENPIYRIGGGSGVGASFRLGFLDSVLGPSSLSLGYLAGSANNPTSGQGLFNGNYGALAQLNFNIGNTANIGFTYVNAYLDANSPIFGQGAIGGPPVTGTPEANLALDQLQSAVNEGTIDQSSYPNRCDGSTVDCYPWFNGTTPLQFGKKVTNSYGVQFAWDVADWMSFSAFGSYTAVKLLGYGTGDIWTYGAGLAFPDLGKEGNLLGLFVGVQPYLSSGNTLRGAISYNNTAPLHIEAFYKFQITDNISLTPGVIYINNPVQTQFSNNSWIGTLRGTFTF